MSEDLTTFLQQLFNGLSLSGLYILVGLGITLVFGLTRTVNFAHGQFLVLGGFVAYELRVNDVDFALAVIGSGLLVGALGVVLDRGFLRHTLDVPMNGFIVSLGLILVMETAMNEAWGAEPRRVSSPLHGVWDVEGVRLAHDRVMVLGITFLLVAALFAFLRWTSMGRAMRAAAEDRTASTLVGVNIGRVITVTFVIGCALAGVGGALLGTLVSFTPFSGSTYVMKGFVVAMIGGLGNVGGAAVAGLLLGLAETMGSAYWRSDWQDGFGFALLIAVLLWRPGGLFRGIELAPEQ